jgi:hypothetical protein
MIEREYRFAKGTPFRVGEAANGNVTLRFTKNNKATEIVITPAMAGEYARQCFADPESFTQREQLLLNAWCLGQRIVAEALAVLDGPGAGAAASTAPTTTGPAASRPAPSQPAGPVSSCRNAECG